MATRPPRANGVGALLALVLALACSATTGDIGDYIKIPRTCMPWADPVAPRVGHCGFDVGTPCNVSLLADACDATPGCNAFNTNGFLKACPGGRCDCDAGVLCCCLFSILLSIGMLGLRVRVLGVRGREPGAVVGFFPRVLLPSLLSRRLMLRHPFARATLQYH